MFFQNVTQRQNCINLETFTCFLLSVILISITVYQFSRTLAEVISSEIKLVFDPEIEIKN